MSQLKQVILMRKDLKMSPGKVGAQAAHSSVEGVFKSNKKLLLNWRKTGMKKILLSVNSLDELELYYDKALKNDITAVLITDAGHTEIASGTKTCVAIGPGPEIKIDEITADLNLY